MFSEITIPSPRDEFVTLGFAILARCVSASRRYIRFVIGHLNSATTYCTLYTYAISSLSSIRLPVSPNALTRRHYGPQLRGTGLAALERSDNDVRRLGTRGGLGLTLLSY